ncbi:zf-BED domain-containing protein [Tanacetum coccineum]
MEECTGGVFRFKHHLARTHQNVSACTMVLEDVKVKIQNILKQNELNSRKRKGMFTIEEVEQPFKRESRVWKMVQMIGEYRRGLDPPSYHEIRVTFLKKEVDYTKSLLEEYKNEWKKTGCTLMSDGWSDRKNRSICNFLVNNPKGTIFLASIDTSDISKTKEKVFAMLDDFVEKIGEEHVVQVVTDNAANYKAAGEMLMDKRKKIFWTPCAAHCIDLMLEDFEKKIEEHKVTIAKEFSNGKELLRPGATRFATSYLTLCRLYELKGALISMFASEEWENSNFAKSQAGKNVESIVLDNVGFWRSVNTCCTAAIPLIKVLRMVDSDSPAMGFILDAMVNAKKEIKNMYKDVQSRYQPVLDIIDQRWENQLQRPLHVAGYYLNPQMQHNSEDVLFNKSTFYKCLETMCGDENLSKKIDLQLDLFKKSKGLFNYSTAKLTRKGKSPADWWDSFGDDTPELKQFALCVLSLTFKWKGRKRKEEDFDFEDVDSDDEWITEDNEDLTNVYENESTTHGDSGDDDFLEEAMRNQYGGNEQSREESSYVFDEGNEVDALAQLEIID